MRLRRSVLLGVLIPLACVTRADVKLPSIFSDHMVLQQEATVPVWGTADTAEKVSVTIGDHSATAAAGADGTWRVDLAPFPNGAAPMTMVVQGKNTITIHDVLIGDVWLGSGQSNMEVNLGYAHNGQTEVPKANDPQMRLYLIARTSSLTPLTDVVSPWPWWMLERKDWRKTPEEQRVNGPGTWLVCTPDSASRCSAVAYFFGKELRAHLKRPIGLIVSAWGGSVGQAWTSLPALQKDPPFTDYVEQARQNAANFPKLNSDYRERVAAFDANLEKWTAAQGPYAAEMKEWKIAADKAHAAGLPLPKKPDAFPRPEKPAPPDEGSQGPANLFNGMLAPLIPYAIKGVFWYQGESNTGVAALEYQRLFARLIGDWRARWKQGDFPFLFVQISHFSYVKENSSPLVREAQLKTLSNVPNTGMVVTVDIPRDDGAHPRDKDDLGKRLALVARHVAYGEELVYSGPLYQSMKVEGHAIRISFTHTDGGLRIGVTPFQPPGVSPFPTDKLVGFVIAGADKKWLPADAMIDGETLLVSSPQVAEPVAVRYGWENAPQCNLYSKAGLPASPFRTDDWNDTQFAPVKQK